MVILQYKDGFIILGDLQTWEAEAKVYRDRSTAVSIMTCLESRIKILHHDED